MRGDIRVVRYTHAHTYTRTHTLANTHAHTYIHTCGQGHAAVGALAAFGSPNLVLTPHIDVQVTPHRA